MKKISHSRKDTYFKATIDTLAASVKFVATNELHDVPELFTALYRHFMMLISNENSLLPLLSKEKSKFRYVSYLPS